MGLNRAKGNMYPWVTHTWNPIKGRCAHDCYYCFMKRWGEQRPPRLDEKELKTDLGVGNFIFVGSSTDMWAKNIPFTWILRTLKRCRQYGIDNTYLYQTKNPERFLRFSFRWDYPHDAVFGVTLETNRDTDGFSKAPHPIDRATAMDNLHPVKTMVTIEPIMDFDASPFLHLVHMCRPDWVNIGANTRHDVTLPEPEPKKVRELIRELEKTTEVRIKKNLQRIVGESV